MFGSVDMQKSYKVIIIGAGPAGISTALNLKKNGIDDVLIVEKKMFPRYKCCAGYITNKTKQEFFKLGLDIEKCHYTLIKDFNIYYEYSIRQKIKNKFLYTNDVIDRVELDNAFFELAKDMGVKVLENRYIIHNDFTEKTITLNDERTLKYETLIFADGMNGYGSKFQEFNEKNIAMQLTFDSTLKNEIQIHFGVTERGYVWVSSNNGITNVGLTDVYDINKNYALIFKNLLERLGLKPDIENLRGAFTPIGLGNPILHGNVYFVGDIVGACDPLTLSGLRYGLKCGEKCALSIAKNNTKIYANYIKSLKIKFNLMKKMQKIFYKKKIINLIFNVGCRYFKGIISFVFNNFFVNKK